VSPAADETNKAKDPLSDTPVAAEEGDRLSLSDHLDYAQQLYGQPRWVIEAVITHYKLDPLKNHAKGVVKKHLDEMMANKDTRYGETK
jgi:hypothetical protein